MANRPVKAVSILWSILLAIGVVAFGVSVILPSTKRARIHFNQTGPDPETVESADAATQPATQP